MSDNKLCFSGFISDRRPNGFTICLDGPDAVYRLISESVFLGSRLEREGKSIIETFTVKNFDPAQQIETISVECRIKHRLKSREIE